jgi:hypothetical protein
MLKIYNDTHDTHDTQDMEPILFYNNYVTKSSEEFGRSDILPSPDKTGTHVFPIIRPGHSLTHLNKFG